MKRIGPNITGASGGNVALADALRQFHERLNDLEQRAGIQGTDSDKQTITMPAPAAASVAVVAAKGTFKISITNPEYQPVGPRSPVNKNPFRFPIHHIVETSPTVDFQSVTSLPAGPQTYYELALSGRHYVRVRSTSDGQNFTTSPPVGPFTA